ncbi:MFS transporter [uncultured Brevundimonas sp.]|uniref:MFS transporter n=1 Tax=uncultured Brevundimonas sp. TaxID=213418 RepID=UPI00262491BC|nr:MFS transporter [uncultured Brevundimonas sp.]
MNASGAPSSESLERDASQINARHGKIDASEIAVGVIIGRTSEFFDFFVYAIASVVVFPQLIFPYAGPLGGTLLSFAVFALAFIARPIGSSLFIAIDRKFGRGTKLTIALMLLGLSTVCFGFLPSYQSAGYWSAVMLMVLRVAQGIALGGTWDGMPSLLAVSAPENKKGWYAMVPQLGAPLGLIVASALFAYFISKLTPQDFFAWGWRYPFFVAFAINVVALFARLRIVVSPTFQSAFHGSELKPSPIGQTLKEESPRILIGTFAPLATFAMVHMVTVYPLSWVFLYTEDSVARFLVLQLIAAAIGVASVVASGVLADRFGRRKLLGATSVGIGIFAVAALPLLDGGPMGEMAYLVIGYILLGLAFGQASGVIASSFKPRNRYTASALTSDLAWLFGAGFAPLAALWISAQFGLWAGGAYLLSGTIVTLLVLRWNRSLAARSSLS